MEHFTSKDVTMELVWRWQRSRKASSRSMLACASREFRIQLGSARSKILAIIRAAM
jgi:hypothetical protein